MSELDNLYLWYAGRNRVMEWVILNAESSHQKAAGGQVLFSDE